MAASLSLAHSASTWLPEIRPVVCAPLLAIRHPNEWQAATEVVNRTLKAPADAKLIDDLAAACAKDVKLTAEATQHHSQDSVEALLSWAHTQGWTPAGQLGPLIARVRSLASSVLAICFYFYLPAIYLACLAINSNKSSSQINSKSSSNLLACHAINSGWTCSCICR